MGTKLGKGVDLGVSIVYTATNVVWAAVFGIGGILMVTTGSGGLKFLGILSILFGAYGAYRTARMWIPKGGSTEQRGGH